jgi:hypothetical protein
MTLITLPNLTLCLSSNKGLKIKQVNDKTQVQKALKTFSDE